MLNMDVDAGDLGRVCALLLCVVAYGRLAGRLSTVVVPEAGGEEKIPLLHGTPAQDELEGAMEDAMRKPLVRWAVAVLPLNAAVCYLACFHLVSATEGTIALWHYMLLAHCAIGPVLSALTVLFYSFVLTHANLKPSSETYHMLRRTAVLDGVLLPPGLVVVAACTFPALFLGSSGGEVQWAVCVGAAVYVSQAVVWAQLFFRSRRESLERAAHCVNV